MNDFMSSIIIGLLISWCIGLLPAIYYRYVFYKSPINKRLVFWRLAPIVALLAILYKMVMAAITGTKPNPNPLPWIIIYYIGMWVMTRDPNNIIAFAAPSIDTRKCPFCAEAIRIDAKICKHCGREIPPAFSIPTKYSLEQLPSSKKQIISNRSPQQNLEVAIALINNKSRHEAIATLQAIIENSPNDSTTYNDAYKLLYVIFKGRQ
jgi:hypothetical protein